MKVGVPRLMLFASGDFAFNLYWQSVMLYLLFYYTEAIHVPVRLASACYALASGWDGIVSLAIGRALHRLGPDRADPRRLLALGALPLGASFALAYLPPPAAGTPALAWVLGGHMLFRFLYALTNIPYLAMSARISTDRGERALVAGGRMLGVTLAAVIVALGTVPLGRLLAGTEGARLPRRRAGLRGRGDVDPHRRRGHLSRRDRDGAGPGPGRSPSATCAAGMYPVIRQG